IQADQIDNAGVNHDQLWAAFAKRGLGFTATSPASSTTAGVHEAFDIPDSLSITPFNGFTSSGPVGGPFTVTSQTFVLTNIGTNQFTFVLAKTAGWLNLSATNGTLHPAGPSVAITVSLDASAASLPMGIYNGAVSFTNLASGVGQSRPFLLLVGQPDYFTEL